VPTREAAHPKGRAHPQWKERLTAGRSLVPADLCLHDG